MEGTFGLGRAERTGGSSAAFEAKASPATRGRREVQIDALADSVHRHVDKAIVCIDLLMSSTSVVTSLAQGRRTLLAATLEEGRERAKGLSSALLLSEPGTPGTVGDANGGVLALESPADVTRDVVVISPAARILYAAQAAPAVYVACLRNMTATAEQLARHHDRVALVGVGHAGEIRYEDQMVAAWIARKLVAMGFEPSGLHTAREVERWSQVDLSVAGLGRGAEHLRRLGRNRELDFVLSRVDDLDLACRFEGGEMRQVWHAPMPSVASH